MKRFWILTIVALALAACAKAISPSASPLVSPLVTHAPSPVATIVLPEIFIVYQRAGGFAGTSDKWTIYPTGRIVSDNGTEWQVPAEQVAPLFKLVESPSFKDLDAKYTPVGTCNDCFTYTVTVYGQGEPQTVTFVDGVDIPPILQQGLTGLNTVIAPPAK